MDVDWPANCGNGTNGSCLQRPPTCEASSVWEIIGTFRRRRCWACFRCQRRSTSMHAREMINSHPNVHGNSADALLRCIEQCFACAQACTSCADACMGEAAVSDLVQCIRLNMDCADICSTMGTVASRLTGSNASVVHQLIAACADACRACEMECRKHADMHEHCRVCADACHQCEAACTEALPLEH